MEMFCLKIEEPEHVNEPQCILHYVWPQKMGFLLIHNFW